MFALRRWWLTCRLSYSRDQWIRAYAAHQLGESRDKRALPSLLKALCDNPQQVLIPVADALAKLGDSRAIAPILQSVSNGDHYYPTKRAMYDALESLGWQPNVTQRVDRACRMIVALRRCKITISRSTPLQMHDHERDEALKAELLRVRSPEAAPLLIGKLWNDPQYEQMHRSPSGWENAIEVKLAIIRLLGDIGGEAAFQTLREVLTREDPTLGEFKNAAARALGGLCHSEVVPLLQKVAKEYKNAFNGIGRTAEDALAKQERRAAGELTSPGPGPGGVGEQDKDEDCASHSWRSRCRPSPTEGANKKQEQPMKWFGKDGYYGEANLDRIKCWSGLYFVVCFKHGISREPIDYGVARSMRNDLANHPRLAVWRRYCEERGGEVEFHIWYYPHPLDAKEMRRVLRIMRAEYIFPCHPPSRWWEFWK